MIAPLELGALNAPIPGDRPCGVDLENGAQMARFDGYRLFGRDTNWEESEPQPNWLEIRTEAIALLQTSKDLRILVHLAAAVLRTDGLTSFCETLNTAANWTETYWDSLYPGLEERGLFRRNALMGFSDRVAIIEVLRRVPLVVSRGYGTFNLRDIDLAQGQMAAPPDTPVPLEAEINAAFAEETLDNLKASQAAVADALQAIKRMEALGPDGTPDFQALEKNLSRMGKLLRERLEAHPAAQHTTVTEPPLQGPVVSGGTSTSTAALGSVRSRQDAIRALDVVAKFFTENEPSSPVPMFIERAKRLVAKNFLEVLEDVAPEAVQQARQAGGVRD